LIGNEGVELRDSDSLIQPFHQKWKKNKNQKKKSGIEGNLKRSLKQRIGIDKYGERNTQQT
jgi:hypothetical protein